MNVDFEIVNGKKLTGKTLELWRKLKNKETIPVDSPAHTITINHGAAGLGDSILGLCAVKGLMQDNRGAQIVYKVSKKTMPFVHWFDGYHILLPHTHDENKNDAPTSDLNLNLGYNTDEIAKRFPIPRWERYRQNIGASKCILPEIKTKQNIIDLCSSEYRGCVCIFPFSSYKDRDWSLSNWIDLQKKLSALHYRVLLIHDTAERTQEFTCEKLINTKPELTMSAILNSVCCIGVDSGLCHLSGVLGANTIVLCGQTPGQMIFGFYPNVKIIQGHLECDGCSWQAPYHSDKCNPYCPSLQTIQATEIIKAVNDFVLPIYSGNRACVAPEKLSVIRSLVLETNHLSGDLCECGVWRGGSAKVIDLYSSHGKTYCFDTFTGLIEDDHYHKTGDFRDTKYKDVKNFLAGTRCVIHKGKIPDTFNKLKKEQRFRFVHLDLDTYESTVKAALYFKDRMVDGGKILFDDYGWQHTMGIQRALHDVFDWKFLPDRKSEYQVVIHFPLSKLSLK